MWIGIESTKLIIFVARYIEDYNELQNNYQDN